MFRFAAGCCCECTCRNSDILLLTDTTGSMSGYVETLKSIFTQFANKFNSPSCRWGVAEYEDFQDYGFQTGWKLRQPFTNDYNLVLAAINAMRIGNGWDQYEQQLAALENAGDEWFTTLEGRTDPNVKRIIIWGGDNPGWTYETMGNPYPSLNTVISKLTAIDNLRVFGLTYRGFFGRDSLDGVPGTPVSGQATAITEATNGQLWWTDLTSVTEIMNILCKVLQ